MLNNYSDEEYYKLLACIDKHARRGQELEVCDAVRAAAAYRYGDDTMPSAEHVYDDYVRVYPSVHTNKLNEDEYQMLESIQDGTPFEGDADNIDINKLGRYL